LPSASPSRAPGREVRGTRLSAPPRPGTSKIGRETAIADVRLDFGLFFWPFNHTGRRLSPTIRALQKQRPLVSGPAPGLRPSQRQAMAPSLQPLLELVRALRGPRMCPVRSTGRPEQDDGAGWGAPFLYVGCFVGIGTGNGGYLNGKQPPARWTGRGGPGRRRAIHRAEGSGRAHATTHGAEHLPLSIVGFLLGSTMAVAGPMREVSGGW